MSGAFSLSHMIVVAVVVLLLFGRGKVASMMGEVGRGLSAFKSGLREEKASEAKHLEKDTV